MPAPICAFPAEPQDIRTCQPPCPLLLLSRDLSPAGSQPPPSAWLPRGCSACSAPRAPPLAWCTCTHPALPAPHSIRTRLPHGSSPTSLWVPYFTCPTPNIPHLLPITLLLRGWCAPSPCTAYHIFGKTHSLMTPRRCESHLGTAAPGGASAVPPWAQCLAPGPGSKGLAALWPHHAAPPPSQGLAPSPRQAHGSTSCNYPGERRPPSSASHPRLPPTPGSSPASPAKAQRV